MQLEKSRRILVFFLLLLVGFVVFLAVVYFKVVLPRKMPTLIITKSDIAVRGSIYTKDSYSLARSKKLYKLSFNPRSIDPDKKELFIKLLEIYSHIPKSKILEAFAQASYTTLSYAISPNTAANLKALNAKLLAYDVFKEYEDDNGKLVQKIGLSIEVSGIDREYPYADLLEPIVGYTRKDQEFGLTIPKGVDGIEKSQDSILKAVSHGKISGRRDIGFNIIQSKGALQQRRYDGFGVVLGIPLKFQQKVESILDDAIREFDSDEVIAGVLHPKTGQILALATSKRFNPKAIRKQDYTSLKIRAIESFEPGSTIKPLVYALLLEKKLINPLSPIDLNDGYYRVGRYIIKDDSIMPKNPTIEDVLLRSSNVGMVKLSMLLSGREFYDGLKAFGLAQITGIDLPYEKDGIIPSVRELSQESSAAKASVSYGYRVRVTFMQLLRSYGAFVNGGYLVTPHITQHFIAQDDSIYVPNLQAPKRAISSTTAQKMQEMLIKVVDSGTGKAARVEEIIVGGKTGTARVVSSSGGYGETYNGSFFGFAKDSENAYVIGVVTFGSSGQHYYGSQTSAPVFQKIAKELIAQGYLKPIKKDKK
ncbi:penicillin-binding protein 2 [Helicobacter canis]|uniref:peptidoglycan D,D-transpeptidase FtsI family protein n=1 Tax=Helicobacter canis TaxID=29419 RepID=UPI002942609B|nr:penicillin-binding protein 2 [Helicobacter canis]